MIDFSKKRLARADEEKIDIRQLAVAELMAWGWDSVDAMLAMGLVKESDTRIDAQHAAINFTAGDEFQKLFKKRVAQLKGGSVLDEYQRIHPTPGSTRSRAGRPRDDGSTRKEWQGELPEPVEDAEILAAMWETIGKLDAGDPKRVDLLDKYDKLKRRQGGGEDDTTIHFYLPRPECDTCPFRGNHIITDPEPKPEPEEEFKEREISDECPFDDEGNPKPGYTVNGKKMGRKPSKKKRGRPKKKPEATPPQIEETASKFNEPIDLFGLEE